MGADRRGREWVVSEKAGILGRAGGVEYRLDHPTVAWRHCEVWATADGICVRDLGSDSGTFVNGQAVATACLRPGDVLRVGAVVLECRRRGEAWVLRRCLSVQKSLQLECKERLTALVRTVADPEVALAESLAYLRTRLGCTALGFVEVGSGRTVVHTGSPTPPISRTVLEEVVHRRRGLWAPRELGTAASSLRGYADLAMYVCPLTEGGDSVAVLYAFCQAGCPRPVEVAEVIESVRPVLAEAWQMRVAVETGNRLTWATPEVCFVARSPRSAHLWRQVWQVARSPYPVVLVGPRGSGKTVLARVLHEWSDRRGRPLRILHCPNLSPELMEVQLFGSRRGAFTGAVDAEGLLRACNGGTLVLDSLESCPLAVQAKLLRVLETQTFYPVGPGPHREIQVDVRFVATFNEDPRGFIQRGLLRADLWDRLAVQVIEVPPLQERAEDIPDLVLHCLSQERRRYPSARVRGFTPAALRVLTTYSWPGNVRQLVNVVRRIVTTVDREVVDAGDVEWALGDGTPMADDRWSVAIQEFQDVEWRCGNRRDTVVLEEGEMPSAGGMTGALSGVGVGMSLARDGVPFPGLGSPVEPEDGPVGVAPDEERSESEGPAEAWLDLPYREALRRFQRWYVQEQLRRSAGNVSRAAAWSQLSRVSFYQLLKVTGIGNKSKRTRLKSP